MPHLIALTPRNTRHKIVDRSSSSGLYDLTQNDRCNNYVSPLARPTRLSQRYGAKTSYYPVCSHGDTYNDVRTSCMNSKITLQLHSSRSTVAGKRAALMRYRGGRGCHIVGKPNLFYNPTYISQKFTEKDPE